MYIFGSRSAHMCRSRLWCCQTPEQAQEALEDETRGIKIGKQIERYYGRKDVRKRMAAREPQTFG